MLVAVVANVTIDRGLDRLFSGPTREVIQNSLIIARAYMQEHAQLIRGDIMGMANDIVHARPLYDQDRKSFRELLTANAAVRNLPGAMLIDKDRNILETAQTGIQLAFARLRPSSSATSMTMSQRSRCCRTKITSLLSFGCVPLTTLFFMSPVSSIPGLSHSSSKPRPASPNMPN